MGEEKLEVYRTFSGSQERHAYFMMAAAGAAIAFAVTQTETAAWQLSSYVWLAAITCWGLSFYLGGRHMAYVRSNQYANLNLLRAQDQADYIDMTVGHGAAAAMEAGIRDAISTNGDRSTRAYIWQTGTFMAGALIYIVWHILEMVGRTTG